MTPMADIPFFILCHTIFNDAFRNDYKYDKQKPTQFLMKYIIVKQATLDEGYFVVATSNQVISNIKDNFKQVQLPGTPSQIIIILDNLIGKVNIKSKDINESVIILSDLFSSRMEEIVLVSNMPKKIQKVIAFYQASEKSKKEWKETDIPFTIRDANDIEIMLREKDPDICKIVDDLIANDVAKK